MVRPVGESAIRVLRNIEPAANGVVGWPAERVVFGVEGGISRKRNAEHLQDSTHREIDVK